MSFDEELEMIIRMGREARAAGLEWHGWIRACAIEVWINPWPVQDVTFVDDTALVQADCETFGDIEDDVRGRIRWELHRHRGVFETSTVAIQLGQERANDILDAFRDGKLAGGPIKGYSVISRETAKRIAISTIDSDQDAAQN